MLEAAELNSKLAKATYEDRLPQLRVDLIQAQQDLRQAPFNVVVLIAGDDHRGCHEVINVLNEWMDPRGISTHVFEDPTQEEAERPPFWRYWRVLPAKGRIATCSGAWMFRAVADRLCKRTSASEFDVALHRIRSFENELAEDGTLFIKFWLHRPEKSAVAELEKAKKAPAKYGTFGGLVAYRHFFPADAVSMIDATGEGDNEAEAKTECLDNAHRTMKQLGFDSGDYVLTIESEKFEPLGTAKKTTKCVMQVAVKRR